MAHHIRGKKIWMFVAAATVVGAIIFASHGAVAKQLDDWDLLPKPEPYTAFFFNDPQTLPTHGAPNAALAAPATITNMQHQKTTYTYKIVATGMGTGDEKMLTEGECTIEHAQTCVIDGAIQLPPLGPRVQVRTDIAFSGRTHDTTELQPRTQSLHYWVSLDAPAGITP